MQVTKHAGHKAHLLNLSSAKIGATFQSEKLGVITYLTPSCIKPSGLLPCTVPDQKVRKQSKGDFVVLILFA